MATETEICTPMVTVLIPPDPGFADGEEGSIDEDVLILLGGYLITAYKYVSAFKKQRQERKEAKVARQKQLDFLKKEGKNSDGSCEKNFDANLTLEELLRELNLNPDGVEAIECFGGVDIYSIPRHEITTAISQAYMNDW